MGKFIVEHLSVELGILMKQSKWTEWSTKDMNHIGMIYADGVIRHVGP